MSQRKPMVGIYDVAIAIGIGVNKEGTGPNRRSKANALQAQLFLDSNLHHARNILLVGGARHPVTGLTEAAGMKMAIDWRRFESQQRLFMEETSTSTLLNATASLAIMLEHGWKSAIICAEALHAARVEATFRKQWEGHHIRIAVIPTYGAYGDSDGRWTTPFQFLAYNTAAGIFSKIKGWS